MMQTPLSIKTDFSLQAYNTFGIHAFAKNYLAVETIDNLQAVYMDSALKNLPKFVLGGGSNVLFTGDFPGLVLHVRLKGRSVSDEDDSHVYLTGCAGENWHDFVSWTIRNGWGGLENLSLIPGTVGAAPVQNIGAYGSELQDFFYSLRAFDFETGDIRTFYKPDCRFAYRDSIFKQEKTGRYVITDVTFALPKNWKPNLTYSDVARAFMHPDQNVSPEMISRVIVDIRKSKLPDPARIGNAGSFFKNPTVSLTTYERLVSIYPQIPAYVQPDGNYRIAAGWLIDQCGWKGKVHGNAGVCETQALVLVNYGQATGDEIVELSRKIQYDVHSRFGLMLEPEPVFVKGTGK